jgi:hypothetical protein
VANDGELRQSVRGGVSAQVLFLAALLCQTTVLPDTLGIKPVVRLVNGIVLVALLWIAANVLVLGRVEHRPATLYRWGLLVFLGYALNIARNLSPSTLGYTAATLPWLALLAVPYLWSYDLAAHWRVFYRFMVLVSCTALVEYALVFGGVIRPTLLVTDRGAFLRGIVTIFYGLGYGVVHERMYGVFAEPGTFAMLLLPAIAYAWCCGNWFVAAVVLLPCLLLTFSLGGYLGAAILLVTYLWWRWRLTRRWRHLVALFMFLAVALAVAPRVQRAYEEKQESRLVRENNVSLFFTLFGVVVRQHPYGLDLAGKSLTDVGERDENYLGSNFALYSTFATGGVLAMVGYAGVLLLSCTTLGRFFIGRGWQRVTDPNAAAAMVSLPALLSFVVQRQTIYDLSLFAFLYAVPIMLVRTALPKWMKCKAATSSHDTQTEQYDAPAPVKPGDAGSPPLL